MNTHNIHYSFLVKLLLINVDYSLTPETKYPEFISQSYIYYKSNKAPKDITSIIWSPQKTKYDSADIPELYNDLYSGRIEEFICYLITNSRFCGGGI